MAVSRPGEVRRVEVRPGEVRPGEVRPDEVRREEVRPGEVRPGEVRPGEVRPDQPPPDQVRPAEFRPIPYGLLHHDLEAFAFALEEDGTTDTVQYLEESHCVLRTGSLVAPDARLGPLSGGCLGDG